MISALGATAGTVGNDLVAKLLPMLAPCWPSEQLTRGGDGTAAPRTQSGGGIGDMLGGSSNSGGSGGAIGEALAENAGGALGSAPDGLFWRKRGSSPAPTLPTLCDVPRWANDSRAIAIDPSREPTTYTRDGCRTPTLAYDVYHDVFFVGRMRFASHLRCRKVWPHRHGLPRGLTSKSATHT